MVVCIFLNDKGANIVTAKSLSLALIVFDALDCRIIYLINVLLYSSQEMQVRLLCYSKLSVGVKYKCVIVWFYVSPVTN